MEEYFLLQSTEDGLSISPPLTESELKERVKEISHYKFMNKDDINSYALNFHMGNALIIKGEIVTPKPKFDFE